MNNQEKEPIEIIELYKKVSRISILNAKAENITLSNPNEAIKIFTEIIVSIIMLIRHIYLIFTKL